MDRQSHWNKVWSRYQEGDVSWFQEKPELSIDLVERHAADRNSRILDVGGGCSRLVDALLEDGYEHVGVLDVAASAIERARERLGEIASSVDWIEDDVTVYKPSHRWDVWHDRAAFHFLGDAGDQQRYVQVLKATLAPGGVAVIATFGPDGPEKCSGLDAMRYSPETLAEVLGAEFELLESRVEIHRTPGGADQQFLYCAFRRVEGRGHDEV